MGDAPSSEESASETLADPPSRAERDDDNDPTSPLVEPATPSETPSSGSSDDSRDVSKPDQRDASAHAQPVLWLTARDRLFVAVLALVALLLMFAHWVRLSGWGMQEVEIERHPARSFEYKLDINTATWVEWAQLEGLGETLARRIVEDRKQRGPFADIDDVQRVKGIGSKKLDAIRMWLRCETRLEESGR